MRDIVPKTNPIVSSNQMNQMNNKIEDVNLTSQSGKTNNSQMLANPAACTITRIPTSEPEATINRNDPKVKRMVYSTLRNYLGAYNNQANQLANKHGNVVRDKGVQEQIEKITATGNLTNLNGRINPTEDDK